MLLEISLSRNCTRQSEVSYDVSKVLMEGDDEACLHRVKLAGMLKSLPENTEKTIRFGRKDVGWELFTLFLYYHHWLWMASWYAKMSSGGNLAENRDSILHDSSICFLPREVVESWSWLFSELYWLQHYWQQWREAELIQVPCLSKCFVMMVVKSKGFGTFLF